MASNYVLEKVNDRYLHELESMVEQIIRQSDMQSAHIRTLQQERDSLKRLVSEQTETIRDLEEKLSIAMIGSEDPEASKHIERLKLRVDGMIRMVDECIDFLHKEI